MTSATPRAHVGSPSDSRLAALARDRAWTLVVCGAMTVWSVALCVVVHGSYTGFRLGRFDLGNMVQTVWSTSEGRLLEMTDGPTGEQMVRFGTHADPFLALLAPLWWMWPSPLSLAFAQVTAVSLGALPLFWLARRRIGSDRAAGLLVLAYLAYPWLAWSALGAIHPVTFAIPLYLFCVWFLERERLLPFAVCAALAMSTGELMGLPIVGLGLWYALTRGRRWIGAAIGAGGFAWTFAAVFFLVPSARGESSLFYGFYDHVGGSPQGVLAKLVTDPATVLGALVEGHDLVYVFWLVLPLCGLFVFAPGLALVGAPQLLANLLSDFRSMTDPRYHSIAAVFPFLMAATVIGVARLGAARRDRAALGVLVVSAVLALGVGPWSRVVGVTPLGGRAPLAAARVDALRDAVALVPDEAPVSSSSVAGGHLSARRSIFTIPVIRNANWVLVDRSDPYVTRPDSPILVQDPARVKALVRQLAADRRWTKLFDRSGVVVFRRSAT